MRLLIVWHIYSIISVCYLGLRSLLPIFDWFNLFNKLAYEAAKKLVAVEDN